MLKKQISIKIEENTYQVKFPTVGQFLDIENMKNSLTAGQYSDMVRSGLKSSYFATDLVDAISCFWILVPELRTDLNFKSYTEVDLFLAKKLVKSYKKDFYPWYNELMISLMEEEKDNDIPETDIDDKSQDGTVVAL